MTIMVTSLHYIEDKTTMMIEIKRILKENGRLLIVEFYKRKTPMGPPINHRISAEELEEFCNENGLKMWDKFSIGDNFYGRVYGL